MNIISSGGAVRLSLTIALAVCPTLVALTQETGTVDQDRAFSEIHGKITVSIKEPAHTEHVRDALFDRYGGHTGRDEALLITPPGAVLSKLSEKAVVYLESDKVDQIEYPPPKKDPVLDQKNLQFHPKVLPILVGTTVDFPNRDNLFHNVFSYSRTKEFDLGRYPKDDSRSVTFDRPGVVRVYCDIHSHMNATILVLKNPYFASPNDDGAYVIPRVPAGAYTLVFWYDREIVERRKIDVKAGESAKVDFSF